MKIINKSVLRDVNDKGLNRCTANDKKYMIAAITVTTRRFGPSGSSKKKNIVLEQIIDVMNKIKSGILFDLKYIV